MDNFRAIPKLNEKLEEMVSSGEARLATVVASYGNEVDVELTGGAIARFPSTHYGPPVGSSGALIATRGGGRLFIPMGIAIPQKPKSGNSWSTQSISTAGDYVWTAQTVLLTFSDLTPGASYELSWTVQLNWWTAAAATGRIGARVTDASGHRFLFTQNRNMRPSGATGSPHDESSWSYSETVVARPDGTVQVCPAFRWASGTTNFQNAYILARID